MFLFARIKRVNLSRKAKTARPGPEDFYVSKNTAGGSRRAQIYKKPRFVRGFLYIARSTPTAWCTSGGKAINRGYLLYCVCPILTAPARQKSAGNTVVLINFFNKAGVAKWANPEGRLIFVYNRLFLSAGGTTTRLKKKAPSKLKIKTAQRQTAPVACLGPERCFCLRA